MAWLNSGYGPGWWSMNPDTPVRSLINESDKDFYTDTDPRSFWGQAGQIVGGGNAAFEDFWNRNYDRYMQQYLSDVELGGGKNIAFSDWVTGKVAGDINTRFQLQAPGARGIDRRLYDPGRFDTSY